VILGDPHPGHPAEHVEVAELVKSLSDGPAPCPIRTCVVATSGLGVDAAVRDVAAAARAFFPSAVLVFGAHAIGFALGQRTSLPVIHVVGPGGAVHPETARVGGARPPRQIVAVTADDAVASTSLPQVPIGTSVATASENLLGLLTEMAHALRCTSHPPTESNAIGFDSFVDYLSSIGPPGLDRSLIPGILSSGMQLGMPYWEEGDAIVFDRARTWQWVFECVPLFFEADKRAHRDCRRSAELVPELRPDVLTRSSEPGGPRRVLGPFARYRVEVTVDIEGRADGASRRVRVFLPFPLERESQREPILTWASHDSLRKGLVPGYVYGVDVELEPGRQKVGYACEVGVAEVRTLGLPRSERPPKEQSLPEVLEEARRDPASPHVRARRVFDGMMEVGKYEKTLNACLCEACCARDFARSRRGHCIVFARAFVTYCRAVGIHARAVHGAMFTYRRGPDEDGFGCSVPGEPVIGHTWAEFEEPGVGWVPVEFDPLVIKAATPVNCWDDDLFAELQDDYVFYKTFYFGNLDAQHIVFSSSCLTIPYALEAVESPIPGHAFRPLTPAALRFDFKVRRA
jgi:hypothetical protein